MAYETNNPKSITLSDEYALKDVSEKIGQVLSLVNGKLDFNAMLTLTNTGGTIKPEIYARKDTIVIDLTRCKIYANIGLIFKPIEGKIQKILIEKDKITIEIDGIYDVVCPVKS